MITFAKIRRFFCNKTKRKIKWTDYPFIDVGQINEDLMKPNNQLFQDIVKSFSKHYTDLDNIGNCKTEFDNLVRDYKISFKNLSVEIKLDNISIRFTHDFKGEFENTLLDYLNMYFEKDVEFWKFINECYDQLYYLIEIYGIKNNDDFTNRLMNIAINTIEYSYNLPCKLPHIQKNNF